MFHMCTQYPRGQRFDHVQVAGFFVGVSAPLVGGALECGVNYLTYTSSLHALASHAACASGSTHSEHGSNLRVAERTNRAITQTPGDAASLTHIAAAAAVAGVSLSFVLAPVELVKCRLQVLLPVC